MKEMREWFALALALSCGIVAGRAQDAALHFNFADGPARPGYTAVAAGAAYSDAVGFGFEAGAPGVFSARVPEGNYRILLTVEAGATPATLTVEAESGRLMVERIPLPANHEFTAIFSTNIRTSHLPKLPLNATGREEVSLDQFDAGNSLDWDNKLTLKVIAPNVRLKSLDIFASPLAPTIFLAGDSTVTDRDGGGDVSWGQLLPRFLNADVVVANHAQSGETLKSFANALRLDKILSQMKSGDYLFIQFGHNDSKASWPQTYADPETTYKAWLKVYIAEAKLRGATPVLVTPMDRGDKKTGAPQHGHDKYVTALKEVAKEENVALIDLYTMSQTFYEHAGADAPKILADGTHSTAYGGYEFAKCIVMGIKANRLGLASFVRDDFKDFDPAKPDSAESLKLDGLFQPNEKHGPGLGPK